MICSNCGTENKAGRKFCVACGTPLAAACPNCGLAVDPHDVFCGECGSPLAASAPAIARQAPPATAPVAERRLVTVLFADLVGFTPFAEERDAEDVRDTLTRYFDLASEVINRYGGRVEKFIGDAVMAVWGAPTAREDDAERAVRAALDLADQVTVLGAAIQARVGVLTGEAAVTLAATNQGIVAGDLVNTAARLQAAAPPGAVLVGDATRRAAEQAIAFEEAGPQILKGKTSPVPAWRALRVVAQRGGQGRSDLPEPPFVGREEEMRLLKDLLATTGRDRRTRLVAISGPGGIGKSRLAWELEKYIDGISETVYWHRGRSPSYGEGVAFWALGEMVRRRCGLAEGDDETTTRDRIRATVAEFVPGEEDRRWVEPSLLTLLGVEPAPAGGRDTLFAAWRIFFERIAERGTTVLLFEDLQWADPGLLDFIEHLLEWARNVPLVVVTLARPELLDRRPDWGADVRNLTRLALEPLSDAAMRQLLAGFVPGLPDAAVAAILQRADGIPLYAVETVRALVADGRLVAADGAYRPARDLGTLAIPETLRSLIASRLDALEPADRALVADASVLGQAFVIGALSALCGLEGPPLEARLKGLVRREILAIQVDPRSPERGQYTFVQSLIQEVAYGTIAKRERRARHLAAARHYEALGDDELAGVLATHYLAAYEASGEGAERDAVSIQARLALSGAADRAIALGGHDQAVGYLRSAIALTTTPAERIELLLRAGRSANAAAHQDQAQTLAKEAADLAAASGDEAAMGRASALLGEVLIDAGNPAEAVQALESADAALPVEGTGPARAEVLSNLSRAYMRTGRNAEAVAVAERALALAEEFDLDRILAETLNNKGSAMGHMGRPREGTALLRAAVEIARGGGHVAAEIRALSNLATNLERAGEASETYRRATELAARVGNRALGRWSSVALRFQAYFLAEDWDEALRAWADPFATDDPASALDEIRDLATRAYFLVARGDPTDDVLHRMEELSGAVSDAFAASAVLYLRSERALVAGDFTTAVSLALQASDTDDQIGFIYSVLAMRPALWMRDLERARAVGARLEADPYRGPSATAHRLAARAGLAALEGRAEEAVELYREARARMIDNGDAFSAALTGLDMITMVGAEVPVARQAAAEARVVFERVGARPYLAFLDAAMSSGAAANAASAGPGRRVKEQAVLETHTT
ncbi:MAG TPA: adenylate/guanylate cyclase domain-containing protein [Candidatus Limnocylindrales bacterium]